MFTIKELIMIKFMAIENSSCLKDTIENADEFDKKELFEELTRNEMIIEKCSKYEKDSK